MMYLLILEGVPSRHPRTTYYGQNNKMATVKVTVNVLAPCIYTIYVKSTL